MNETNWLGIQDFIEFDAYYYYDKTGVFKLNAAIQDYLKNFRKEGGMLATFKNLNQLHVYNPKNGMYEECEAQMASRIDELLAGATKRSKVEEFLWQLKAKCLIHKNREEVEAPLSKILVGNGIYDLKEKKLEAYSKELFFFSRITTNYDEKADCPKIKEFLNSVVNNEDDRQALIELAGYLLYRGYPLHKAFFLQGSGANGKSTLQELYTRFIGEENVIAVAIQHLGARFATIRLLNKHANIVSDLPAGDVLDSGMFKQLTGEDRVQGELKGIQKVVVFKNYAKMIFSANTLPILEDQTIGAARRLRVITFPNSFPQNPHFIEEISTPEELSGLLNIALTSLPELLERGMFTGDKGAEESLKEYSLRSDSVSAFCIECIEEDYDKPIPIPKNDVLSAYFDYCKQKRLIALSDRGFYLAFNKKFPRIRETKKDNIKCYSGLKLIVELTPPNQTSDNESEIPITLHHYDVEQQKLSTVSTVNPYTYSNSSIPTDKDKRGTVIMVLINMMDINKMVDLEEVQKILLDRPELSSIIAYMIKNGDLIKPINGKITFSSSIWAEYEKLKENV